MGDASILLPILIIQAITPKQAARDVVSCHGTRGMSWNWRQSGIPIPLGTTRELASALSRRREANLTVHLISENKEPNSDATVAQPAIMGAPSARGHL
jgi:hypothetical protein